MVTHSTVSIWSYDGRTSRTHYFVVLLMTSILGGISGTMMFKGGALGVFSGVFFLAVMWVSLCVCARRFHDIGHSGWWSLLAFVPVVNFLVGLYALFAPGQSHDNDFGPPTSNPRSSPPLVEDEPSPPQPSPPMTAKVDVAAHQPAQLDLSVSEPLEEFWAQALNEFDTSAMKAGLWAKAFADAGGDERVAKASYMRLRATQLQAQHDQTLKTARDQALRDEQDKQRAKEAEAAELLAKSKEEARAKALLPKGKCSACAAVIPWASSSCPDCSAVFSADSKCTVVPLNRYEAIAQKALDNNELASTRPKEQQDNENTRSLILLGIVLLLVVLAVVASDR